ncbi:aminopeptidase PepB [Plesiomonas sp.]|uniref:aminopeptidase PepB n=1 Tax=Plesiomonas sp. TaxID=2486279 RepID=UPI003F330338
MSDVMSVFLSYEPAARCWGEKALISISDHGVNIHLSGDQQYEVVQRAARKLDAQGIRSVALQGDNWSSEYCWAFHQGFRASKGERKVTFPDLPADQLHELSARITCADWVRDTINLSAEELGPQQLASRAGTFLKSLGGEHITFKVITGSDLREQGYSGIYTVGRGSDRIPAMLQLDFNPTGLADAPVMACLVGKGITFDSGGYSLKQSSFMDSMKSDMGGAALAAGALGLAITRGLKQRVKLYLCCAENMVSGNAYKLGDIIRYRNGKTVEILNTDAEGRLVLADGLLDADQQNAGLIIDCATLTGAAKTALGNEYHALFSFDDALSQQMLVSAEEEHEAFWRLPLAEVHRQQLPSNFADLCNISTAAYTAGASTAAGFLSHFLTNYKHNWLHLDCSATYRKSANDLWSVGATGIGVRSLANLLLKRAAQGNKAKIK